jgi:hypothetical protein
MGCDNDKWLRASGRLLILLLCCADALTRAG